MQERNTAAAMHDKICGSSAWGASSFHDVACCTIAATGLLEASALAQSVLMQPCTSLLYSY